MLKEEILVSVIMPVYNHEPYIAQAIEGVLMQRTTFRYELIIGEDCSTDKSREIIREYQKKYPDIMRTREHRQRLLYGERENHCNSNKIFREKVCRIDEKLAERYANHPALILWHISNEMYGICHCETCQASFRKWLQGKYKTIDCGVHYGIEPFGFFRC